MYINPYIQPQYDPMAQYRQSQYMQQAQPQQQVVQTQMPLPVQPIQDERIWVQGEGAAQAYLVAPNSFVRIWDSTKPVFYEKRADATGKPSMAIYDYSLRQADSPKTEEKQTIGRTDYDDVIKALESKIEALEGRMERYESESYDDDTGIYEVQEELSRQSARRSPKVNPAR